MMAPPRASLVDTLRFRLLFNSQDMLAQLVESFFGDIAEQGIFATGQRRSDVGPILRLQRSKGRRKEMAILHQDVMPLLIDEIANDRIDGLPKHFTIS